MTGAGHSDDPLQVAAAATLIAATMMLTAGAPGGPPANAAGSPEAKAVAAYRCGSISVRFEGDGTHRYVATVTRGKVSCRRARRIMRRFIERSYSSLGWTCFRGHGTDRWAAACSSAGRPTRIIRAYLTS
jgi:hypothetical protein